MERATIAISAGRVTVERAVWSPVASRASVGVRLLSGRTTLRTTTAMPSTMDTTTTPTNRPP